MATGARNKCGFSDSFLVPDLVPVISSSTWPLDVSNFDASFVFGL